MATPCTLCACTYPEGTQAHAVLSSLAMDDIDAALAHGLLDVVPCPTCEPRCNALVVTARDARQTALAARDRHRARDARLHRRKAVQEAARVPKASPTQATVFPAAAADALARALAKAKSPR